MNKRKLILPIMLAFGVVMLFMLLGGTVAYLTDTEAGVNVITIGNVGLVLTEPKYKDNKILSAGSSLEKNPILTNSGTKDEFVFIEVAVPKRTVTLLYEDTTTGDNPHKEGTPVNVEGTASLEEIYKIIADGHDSGATAVNLTENGELENNDNNSPKIKPQLDFSYNKGVSTAPNASDCKEGWIYLTRKVDQTVTENVNGSNMEFKYDYYYFGYNKKLSKDGHTVPLFDRVQLKSFIDEEINSTPKTNEKTKIMIKGYGIQADSLGIPNLDTDGFQNKEMLNKIFNIVKNKKR